uniref:hypothetical protein n=1 Tax=uncultured Erythrobacter sp. TaxID=263913 RepID=UPI002604191D|nr:hypothetical protein [uncultured Erythrobacter sp.]
MDAVFREFLSRYEDGPCFYIEAADIDRWAGNIGVPWSKFLDLISAELARRYEAGMIGYEFGDAIANDLWSALMERSCQVSNDDWPKLCQAVYFAFDAGEYRRKKDGDADPVELYTVPAISQIVANLG